MKVFARLLQKAAESRGSASGRAPQGAEHPIAKKRRRGSPLLRAARRPQTRPNIKNPAALLGGEQVQ